MIHPKLIIFEGPDAAGKSSVCQKYVELLQCNGVKAKLLAFPGKLPNTIGELVYRLHHDSQSVGVNTLTPTSLQALHIAAHLDAIESSIIPALNAGETVVLDRYWWSTWVYGIVGGVSADVLSSLIEAERLAWGKWQPSVVFHVTRLTPLREEPADVWEKLQREYVELSKKEAQNYPVRLLQNEGALVESVAKAFADSYEQ